MNARALNHDGRRRALLAKVHIGKKELGLDDDTWRDLVERVFNTRSVAGLSSDQLTILVEELKKKGFQQKPRASQREGIANPIDVPRETINGPNAGVIGKLRALWLSLYHLGIVSDPKDSAIEAFVRRQTLKTNNGAGVTKLRWLPQAHAYLAIEALKSWATREGVDWGASKEPRDCILIAMTGKCVTLGIFQYDTQMAARSFELFGNSRWPLLTAGQKDKLIQIIGSEIREKLGREAL